MKVVIDTNVLMSGIFFGGTPGQVLDAWKEERITLGVSPDIVEEYRRVGEELESKYGNLEVTSILALVASHAEVVDPADPEDSISRDPDDDKFLVCALAVGASVVVSGDQDLQAVGSWKGIRVRSPRQFVDEFLADLGEEKVDRTFVP